MLRCSSHLTSTITKIVFAQGDAVRRPKGSLKMRKRFKGLGEQLVSCFPNSVRCEERGKRKQFCIIPWIIGGKLQGEGT